METIKTIFRIGHGPSSSHTMALEKACKIILERFKNADRFEVILFNSLASTGQGHFSFDIVKSVLKSVTVTCEQDKKRHPNFFIIKAFLDTRFLGKIEFESIGGGSLSIDGKKEKREDVYRHSTFNKIKTHLKNNNLQIDEYIFNAEDKDFFAHLKAVWEVMKNAVKQGLNKEGVLPGKLKVKRKAKELFNAINKKETDQFIKRVSSYAFAVSEENASGGLIVTAPTCGASGVLPAVLYYYYHDQKIPEEKIIKALAVAGLIGDLVRENATISGACGGCQAEIGTACSMAAAACSFLFNASIDEIEYAAEIAMEHHLGLTCDPVDGYVQIPCIERNAVAAIRAINASLLAETLSGTRLVSFDTVVKTMYQTGIDMDIKYRETAEAGLAYFYHNQKERRK